MTREISGFWLNPHCLILSRSETQPATAVSHFRCPQPLSASIVLVAFPSRAIEVVSMAMPTRALFQDSLRSKSTPLFKFMLFLFLLSMVLGHETVEVEHYPLVVSTWPFVEAVRAAWKVADGGSTAVDSVVEGCSTCEELRCDGTVGPGGSPDENGETTIDALVMDGATMEVGAVGAMRYVKDGIKAARLVMQHTEHTLLVGEKASSFAISMGLPGPTNLSSSESIEKWAKWKANNCQPNFWKNVLPENSCGPYRPTSYLEHTDETCLKTYPMQTTDLRFLDLGHRIHDTISMAVIDRMGHTAVGTSTNGAMFKIPGRVGDGPIVGSSAYANEEVGACCATGDVVESMRLGMNPELAAKDAIGGVARKFPDFMGAIVAVNKKGEHRSLPWMDISILSEEPCNERCASLYCATLKGCTKLQPLLRKQ
ncbi:hypothetical protein Ahy_A07g033893 isoform A [Arachis hypogaea]|uniref:beta-aspartyl-peptidase n=2 Tax=Arachis hypogaea TaxID=3818 RepID=A0A445CAD4_ARAHY|nr:hypothetical protein Ahy_A07g033893 isoform A [Arachis hypogaea]